ncbi:MAG TPA: thioredoxin domain-containing protein [Streptosporangiaceae bacterium]
MNRLATATSPYLLQHADNPVDWWPWSEAAFIEARRRDVLVLLSVGYAACHWCHVMAHESFEDEQTAALVNEHMVAIKVDREERPDVDAVYMTATQAMTGQGGWPMTVVMTPDGEPIFCGTYLPKPAFQQLIGQASGVWRDQREAAMDRASHIVTALRENAEAVAKAMRAEAEFSCQAVTDEAVIALSQNYDRTSGGFGGAPKVPPSMLLEFLLRYHERTAHPVSLSMAEATLDAMARGGIYDQLGGGFARYSTDATWTVPHFEKMLYDNALLARVYAHQWRLTGSGLARRIAEQTCDWMLRELRTREGGFAASLDADTEGVEGKFYVWTPAELTAVLGPDDAAYAADVFGVTAAGTFEHGASVLQLREDPADADRFARVRDALLAAREGRVRPGRDDKVVAAWNGLAISALAQTGLLLDRPDLVEAATATAHLLASLHVANGMLVRTSRDGAAGTSAGVLEDYACVAEGLLTLSGVTGEARWVALAGTLLDVALAEFTDGSGGFYDTPSDGEPLIFRPADTADGATPSGAFAMAAALLSYSALAGSARHRAAAMGTLSVLPAIVARYARAGGTGLAVAEALISGPAEIAIVGDPADPRTADLHKTALHAAPPGAVIALGAGTGTGSASASGDVSGDVVPLLVGRTPVNGAPAAYVCRNFTCLAPVTTPEELRDQLTPR